MNKQKEAITLCELPIGTEGIVIKLLSSGIERRRMLDLGLVEKSKVQSVRKSPLGDPIAYNIRGAIIALRSEEASKVMVEVEG